MKIKNTVAPKKMIKVKSVVDIRRKAPKPAQAAGAQLVYNGGSLLANVEVTAIYWGSPWANDPLQPQLDKFFEFAVGSSMISNLSEYSVPGFTIGPGTTMPSQIVITQDPPSTVDDTQIQAFLQGLIDAGTINPNANSLFFVFTPSGVTVTLQGSSSCVDFCGYHYFFNDTNGNVVCYAVMPYPDCVGCQFANTTFDTLTTIASHEFSEAITDPQLDAWYDPNTGEEIGDICAGNTKVITSLVPKSTASTGVPYNVTVSPTQVTLDGVTPASLVVSLTPAGSSGGGGNTGGPYTVQTEWSNAQNACV
jgi:hypothetical protein